MSLLLEALKTAALKKQKHEQEISAQGNAQTSEQDNEGSSLIEIDENNTASVEQDDDSLSSAEIIIDDEFIDDDFDNELDNDELLNDNTETSDQDEAPYIELDLGVEELELDENEINSIDEKVLQSNKQDNDLDSNAIIEESSTVQYEPPISPNPKPATPVESPSSNTEETIEKNSEPLNTSAKEEKIQENKSHEAFNQLIHQQNSRYKKSQMMTILMLCLLAMILVVATGYLFYADMLKEQLGDYTNLYNDSPSEPYESASESTTQQASIVQQNTDTNRPEAQTQNSAVEHERFETKNTGEAKKLIDLASKIQTKLDTGDTSPISGAENRLKPNKEAELDDGTEAIVSDHKWEKEPDDSGSQSRSDSHSLITNRLKIVRRKISNKSLSLTQQAYKQYQYGHYTKAKKLYRRVLSKKPDYKNALLGMAAISIKENKIAQAKKYYVQVLQRSPNDTTAVLALNQLRQSIVPLKAEQLLKNKLQKNPENPELQASIGNLYASQARWKQAQSHYFNAYSLDTGNASYCYNLAISLDNLAKTEQAISYYKKALLLFPNGKYRRSKAPEFIQKRLDELTK